MTLDSCVLTQLKLIAVKMVEGTDMNIHVLFEV